jgi:multiple sugar transport system ATP-binding protein
MASIAMQNVTKVFDRRTTAISNFTLDVRDGEFMVLVGPSGCGKTTILRLIAGLDSPTVGEIRIADRTANGVPPRDRDVAMVFQDGVLYPHMNVYANLAFPLRMRGQRRAEVRRRVDAVVEMLGLADLVDRKPAALSGGQRQRVALGRAVVREPAVFLFDEPLSSLDPALRLAMREEIKALHRKLHTTMLYVTHDQSEAMALGERVCVLREGQIQQVGGPTEVYDRPANRFVAAFLGSPPMNFLTGCIRFENGVGFVDLADARVPLPGSLSSHLAECGDKTVLVGVRPHDLSLEPSPQQRINALPGRVSLLEPFGSRTDVHVMLFSGEKCIISLPPHIQLRLDEEVRVYVDSDKLHLFECGGSGLMLPCLTTGS